MRNRSVFSVDSFAEMTEFRYCTSPMAARIEMSEMTISSSTSVNPPGRPLPVLVFRTIERLGVGFRENVEDIAAPPRCGVGSVRVRPHSPLGALGHGIDGNPPEKLELHTGRVVVLGDAVHQRFEARRVVLAAGLDL